jgi:hypothetical protein
MRFIHKLTKHALVALFLALMLVTYTLAQSSDQSFPTPVRTTEITGVIKARDIGDSRLTSHFYTFDGGQGDLFINVQTANFSGDIDVYVMPGLRPLTKMVMYADAAASETGRVIYLRKPETILLRIEGRTPGDEEATYRIKFAGSFVASRAPDNTPEAPKVTAETDSNIRVNSVGTIIEVLPKPTPVEARTEKDEAIVEKADENLKTDKSAPLEPLANERVVVTDPLAGEPKPPDSEKPLKRAANGSRAKRAAKKPPIEVKPAGKEVVTDRDGENASKESVDSPSEKRSSNTRSRNRKSKTEPAEEIDPMANVQLVIRFKDGSTIERPMKEVFKFTVERAILTVISKDGTIGRYRMIEVAGVTIE